MYEEQDPSFPMRPFLRTLDNSDILEGGPASGLKVYKWVLTVQDLYATGKYMFRLLLNMYLTV